MSARERSHAPRGWDVLKSAVRFKNKLFRLREDTISLPAGKTMDYAYVERGPAVIIVPVTKQGEMVLVRQYRYPVDEQCLEVPAGTASDAGGLSLEEVAAKELEEEVGATCERLENLGSFYSNSSMTDEACHVFLATGVVFNQSPEREPAEEIETVVVPVHEAVALASRGAMKTGPSALAVLLAVRRLRELGLV